MSEPCFKCGAARSCKHRAVETPQIANSADGPSDPQQKRPGNLNSRFGRAGNPTKRQFEKHIKDAFKS